MLCKYKLCKCGSNLYYHDWNTVLLLLGDRFYLRASRCWLLWLAVTSLCTYTELLTHRPYLAGLLNFDVTRFDCNSRQACLTVSQCQVVASAVLSLSVCRVPPAAADAPLISSRARSYARCTAAHTFALLFAVNLMPSSSASMPRGSSFLRGNQRLHTQASALISITHTSISIQVYSSNTSCSAFSVNPR